LFHPAIRAVALCCMLIAALPFMSRKACTQPLQTAASPTAQISEAPKPAEYGWIEGVVVDPQGKPVDGAYVYAVGDAEGKLPLAGRWPGGTSTTTNSEGKFVLGHVVENPVSVWAGGRGYYAGGSILNMGLVPGFNTPKVQEVEIKPGQTVTVRLQLAKKAGKIKLYVRDADTKELLVDGIFSEWCSNGVPMSNNCGRMSGEADYESLVSTDVDLSIRIEARDGLHDEWKYRNPKTGSRYYRARSGKTETVNVYLRKTPWHKGTILPEPPPVADFIHFQNEALEPPSPNSDLADARAWIVSVTNILSSTDGRVWENILTLAWRQTVTPETLELEHTYTYPNDTLEPPSPNRWDLRSVGELREGTTLTPSEVRWTPELEYTYPTTDVTLYWGIYYQFLPRLTPTQPKQKDIFWLRRIGRFWKTRL
jgi:hypothetical protein